jgi:pimeloyl-ACP methyl ester carboxylesterase
VKSGVQNHDRQAPGRTLPAPPDEAAAAPSEHVALLPSGNVSYTTAGLGEPVLLIHGLGGTRATWTPLIDALARTHRVIAPDLPGHGDSAAPAGDYSLGAHATVMRDLLIALGHRSATVIGHSLGGGIALQFASQFPDRTSRLVLIGSGGLGPELTVLLRAATLPGAATVVSGLARVPRPLTRSALRAISLVPGLIAAADADPFTEGIRGLAGPRQRTAFISTAHSVIDWRGQSVSADRQLAVLADVPMLAAWGSQDRTIPPHHHRALAAQLPHARTVEIDGAGHYPHETHAGPVIAHIQQFLASTAPYRYTEARWRELLATVAQPAGGDGESDAQA